MVKTKQTSDRVPIDVEGLFALINERTSDLGITRDCSVDHRYEHIEFAAYHIQHCEEADVLYWSLELAKDLQVSFSQALRAIGFDPDQVPAPDLKDRLKKLALAKGFQELADLALLRANGYDAPLKALAPDLK